MQNDLNIGFTEKIFMHERRQLCIIECGDILYNPRGGRGSRRVVSDLDCVVEDKIFGHGVVPIYLDGKV